MDKVIDFDKISPCGECCDDCGYFQSKECEGCLKTKGKCVKLWSKECEIFKCCVQHEVKFCGICQEFPCKWLEDKLSEWDMNGIARLTDLANEYQNQIKM